MYAALQLFFTCKLHDFMRKMGKCTTGFSVGRHVRRNGCHLKAPSEVNTPTLSVSVMAILLRLFLLEWCNPWPHAPNRHISISQLLSL